MSRMLIRPLNVGFRWICDVTSSVSLTRQWQVSGWSGLAIRSVYSFTWCISTTGCAIGNVLCHQNEIHNGIMNVASCSAADATVAGSRLEQTNDSFVNVANCNLAARHFAHSNLLAPHSSKRKTPLKSGVFYSTVSFLTSQSLCYS